MFFPAGGIGRYVHELCHAQNQLGHCHASIVCNPDFAHQQEADYPVHPLLYSLSSRFPPVRRARFLLGQWISPTRFLRYANQVKPDVVHFSNINHLTYAFWRSKLQRLDAKVCCTAHDVRRASKIVNRSWEDKWLKQFYRDCDAVFVHSDAQKTDLHNFANVDPSRIHIVPFGLFPYPVSSLSRSQLRAKYRIPDQRIIALFFGFLRDDKNLSSLLRAVAMLKTKPFLIIAGSAGTGGKTTENSYARLVNELGIGEDVKLITRHIMYDEVGELFHLSDFVPMTYRQNFSSQSGVLNVAAFYQKPILVTPSPTMSETVRSFHIGEVCESDQPDAIALGIQRITAKLDHDWSPAFGRYRHEHSWENAARKSMDVYGAKSGEQRANN